MAKRRRNRSTTAETSHGLARKATRRRKKNGKNYWLDAVAGWSKTVEEFVSGIFEEDGENWCCFDNLVLKHATKGRRKTIHPKE
jgi:hypothetical protein